jgi:membrane protein implicated in regulation of membrane protease activity
VTLAIFFIILAFAAGVAVCLAFTGPWWPLLMFAVALAVALVLLWKRVPVQ